MSFFWISAVKDLRRRLRDPAALLVWLGLPFFILTMLTLAFGGDGGGTPQAHLLVVDDDDTLLSGLLVGAFGQGQLAELIRVDQVEREAGEQRIAEGDGSALLIIPAGFATAVLEEQPATLTLRTNPAQRILPGIVEETLSIVVDAAFYAQRLAGPTLREIRDLSSDSAGPSDAVVAGIATSINQRISGLDDYLFPPVIDLVLVRQADDGPDLDLGQLFFQSMFFMAVFFMAQGMSDDIWNERSQGTLRRLLTTPRSLTAFLAAKGLAVGLLMAIVATAALAAGCWLYGFSFARLPGAVLWVVLSGMALYAGFTLLQIYATSQRAGSILVMLITFPLLFLGGSFFPFEAMPESLARIGRLTPNGWALEQLKPILSGDPDLIALARGALLMLLVVGAVYVLSVRRIKRHFIGG